MPKIYSLKLKKEFQKLYRNGIRKSSKNFSLVFMDSKYLKFAIVVAKKDIPKATARVYSKRIIREIVRKDFLESAKTKKPLYISIQPKVNLQELIKSSSFEEVRKEVLALLSQINFNAPAFKQNQKRTFNNQRRFSNSPKNSGK